MAQSLITSRQEPLQTGVRKAKWPRLIRELRNIVIALVIVTSPIWGIMLLLDYSFRYGPGRGDYPAVAPEADFETRRAWGQEEMFEYFELAEKWVRDLSLIVEDVGTVTGVAPIGSPNRFYAGGFTDGAHCAMNLQVIGEKGEGVLRMPEVSVNNGYQLYGIADNSTWKFGDKTDLILLNGKSWPQEVGLDTFVDQIRESYNNKQYEDVVTTCDSLQEKIGKSDPNAMIAPYEYTYAAEGMFGNLPFMLRVKVLQRYAESLFQLGNDEQAFKPFRVLAESYLDQVGDMRYRSSSKERDPSRLPESLEAARAAILKASMLRPDDKELMSLAKERYLWARDVRCDNFFMVYDDDDLERNGIQRSLGECYNCVVSEAQKSSWLRGQVGSMTFRPKLNHSNDLRINKHGLYDAFVVVEVDGTLGRSGMLEIHVREDEAVLEPQDLNSAVPREPSFPFLIRRVRWTDSSDKKIKLSSKTLAPYKKK